MHLEIARLHDVWRSVEAEVRAAEDELYAAMRSGRDADPALISRVRGLRREASDAFRAFLAESERAASALNWARQRNR